MIRVRMSRDWGDGSITDHEEWEIEVDAAYSPDIAEDLARRVMALRAADRADTYRQMDQRSE